ncbi:MAG: DUF2232 domain-containing protein [Halobacteriovoraceae bacterium]|nr:DUF2232 domain-containing protein [Halobacteriovoraceae bacterium]
MSNTGPEIQNPTVSDLNWSRWFFLSVVFIVLSTTGLLSLFAPAPILFSLIMYGKNKTMLMGAFSILVIYLFSIIFNNVNPLFFGVVSLSFFYGVMLYQIFVKEMDPVEGIVKIGAIIAGLSFLILGLSILGLEISVVEQFEKILVSELEHYKQLDPDLFAKGGERARYLEDVLKNPKEMATTIVSILPSVFFVGIFLSLWASLFSVLRASHIWIQKSTYPYTSNDLVNFKSPNYLVYFLIVGLSCVLFSDFSPHLKLDYVGGNILACVGVFYFFQGFGIYISLLNKLQIKGFIRSLFVVFTIWSLWHVVVIVGVFDQWFDFRKMINRNKEN